MMEYRSSVHETTGVSPCKVMHGNEIKLPIDLLIGKPGAEDKHDGYNKYAKDIEEKIDTIHAIARKRILKSSNAMKKCHDRNANQMQYKAGDAVWLLDPKRKIGFCSKLQRPWHGPYIVVNKINDIIYRIQLNPKGKFKIVHHNTSRLKAYNGERKPEWFSRQ